MRSTDAMGLGDGGGGGEGGRGTGLLSWHFIENHEISRARVAKRRKPRPQLASGPRISRSFFSPSFFQSRAVFDNCGIQFARCSARPNSEQRDGMRTDAVRKKGYLGDLPGASLENGSTPFTVKGRRGTAAAEERARRGAP